VSPRQSGIITGPPSSVTIPQSDMVAVSKKDWRTIRRDVDGLKHPVPYAGNFGWFLLAFVPAAGLFLLGWLAAYGSLPDADKVRLGWVEPVVILAAVAGLVVGCFFLFLDRKIQQSIGRDSARIVQFMDDCYPPDPVEVVQGGDRRAQSSSSPAISSHVQM